MCGTKCQHVMRYVPDSEPWANKCERCGLVLQFSPAEQVVGRLDSYSGEQHAEGVRSARQRADRRREARSRRAEDAAARLNLSAAEGPTDYLHLDLMVDELAAWMLDREGGSWAGISQALRDKFRNEARATLGLLAPLVATKAWDRGFLAGASGEAKRADNPHRTTGGWCPVPNEAPIDHGLLTRGCSACGWVRS